MLLFRDFGCERKGSCDLPFVDAVVEVAVVDEEVGAALVAVCEDGQGEVEAEDDNVVDAAAVIGVDAGRDAEAVPAGIDGEVGFAALAVEALGVPGEQQDRFVCLLPAFPEIEVDGLLQFNALGGDLAGAGFESLCCVEAVPKGAESGLFPAQGCLQGGQRFQRPAVRQLAQEAGLILTQVGTFLTPGGQAVGEFLDLLLQEPAPIAYDGVVCAGRSRRPGRAA